MTTGRNYYLQIEIHFKNGTQTDFYASEFDVDLSETQSPSKPHHRYTYKGPSGTEHPSYLVINEIAGRTVSESYN